MKNKNLQLGFAPLLIIIAIIAVLTVGGGVYVATKKEKIDTEDNVDTQVNANLGVNANINAKSSLRSLLALGRDQVCTFNSGTGASEVSGTMYLSGSMVRGDFSSKGPSGVMEESHMIKQGDVVFTWSGNKGAKLGMSQMNTNVSSQNSGSFGLSSIFDQNLNYKCNNWSKDNAKFSTPSGIVFEDLEALEKSMKLKVQ